MISARRLLPRLTLALPILFACSDDGGANDSQMFTQTTAVADDDTDTVSDDEVGTESGDTMGSTEESGTMDEGESSTSDTTSADDTTSTDTNDGTTTGGGECATPQSEVGQSCGQDAGNYGLVAAGESVDGLPLGTIYKSDNGLGNGYEDWYRVEFPVDPNMARPFAGTAEISFASNDNEDYRFEVYRDCGAQVYGQGLASDFGSNAPPLTEWSFDDLDPGPEEQLEYLEMVPWPTTVIVRVFRFGNDETCSGYQLQVSRQ